LRLLTFNTFFFDHPRPRLRALSEIIDRSGLDVVCLQEILWRRNLSMARSITTPFPYAAHVPHGPMVKGGLLTLSRWPIEHRYVEYRVRSASGRWPYRLDWLLRKGLLVTRISIAGRHVAVVNTHLLANSDGDWSRTNPYARAEEAELNQLAEVLTTIDPDLPLLVVGDFNVPRGSWLLDEFLARSGLRDVLAGDPRPTFRPTPRIPTSRALDHVLVRHSQAQNLAVEADLVFEEPIPMPCGRSVYLSDHYGIEVLVRLDDAPR
jgi:endonuclease/exonuclease/phosphatase (EEP) superfamily protein YafD